MRYIFLFFALYSFIAKAQTHISDIANISIDVPLGFHFIEDWERQEYNVSNNSIAFLAEEASEGTVFDLRSLLGLINDDVFECFYYAPYFKDIKTPLQKKRFQDSKEYQELLQDFLHYQTLFNDYPICFSVTNLNRYASNYDLDNKGFLIKLPFLWTVANKGYYGPEPFPWNLCHNGEIGFNVSDKILKKYFTKDYYSSSSMRPQKFYKNEFFVNIANEDIAAEIEAETNDSHNFGVVCLAHLELKNKKPTFVVNEIILYHRLSESVIWCSSRGDLSQKLNLNSRNKVISSTFSSVL